MLYDKYLVLLWKWTKAVILQIQYSALKAAVR